MYGLVSGIFLYYVSVGSFKNILAWVLDSLRLTYCSIFLSFYFLLVCSICGESFWYYFLSLLGTLSPWENHTQFPPFLNMHELSKSLMWREETPCQALRVIISSPCHPVWEMLFCKKQNTDIYSIGIFLDLDVLGKKGYTYVLYVQLSGNGRSMLHYIQLSHNWKLHGKKFFLKNILHRGVFLLFARPGLVRIDLFFVQ